MTVLGGWRAYVSTEKRPNPSKFCYVKVTEYRRQAEHPRLAHQVGEPLLHLNTSYARDIEYAVEDVVAESVELLVDAGWRVIGEWTYNSDGAWAEVREEWTAEELWAGLAR